MRRNMIAANEELFSLLRTHLPADSPQISKSIPRWIATNQDEKRWLKEVVFLTDSDLRFGGHYRMSIASFNSESFLVSVDFQPNLPTDDFDFLEVNAGLFCAAVVELKIEPLVTESIGLELIQNVFLPLEDMSLKGVEHAFTAIREFFPPIFLFKIRSASPLLGSESSLFRVALFTATKSPELMSLPWTSEGLEIARAVSTLEKVALPFELVLRAVLERKWEHAFLEIYRCMEFLFPFPKVNELKKRLKLDESTAEVSASIEDILGWRPLEEVAIQALFKPLAPDNAESFCQALGMERRDDTDINKAIATFVYRLRNDCVHFRPVQRKSTLRENVKWELLLQEMLRAVNDFYINELRPV